MVLWNKALLSELPFIQYKYSVFDILGMHFNASTENKGNLIIEGRFSHIDIYLQLLSTFWVDGEVFALKSSKQSMIHGAISLVTIPPPPDLLLIKKIPIDGLSQYAINLFQYLSVSLPKM